MTTHNDELKPCAFCGGPATNSGEWTGCSPCEMWAESAQAWNRRAEQPQPAPMQIEHHQESISRAGSRPVAARLSTSAEPMQVDSYPIAFDEYAKGCSWTRDVREFGIRRDAFSAGYEAALASRALQSTTPAEPVTDHKKEQ